MNSINVKVIFFNMWVHHRWSRAKSHTKEKGKSFVGLPTRGLILTEDGGGVLRRGGESRRGRGETDFGL